MMDAPPSAWELRCDNRPDCDLATPCLADSLLLTDIDSPMNRHSPSPSRSAPYWSRAVTNMIVAQVACVVPPQERTEHYGLELTPRPSRGVAIGPEGSAGPTANPTTHDVSALPHWGAPAALLMSLVTAKAPRRDYPVITQKPNRLDGAEAVMT